jgi:hypothetical protein
VVARRELVTAATDHAPAGDPAIGLGMLPRRAAAWWAAVLAPIHLVRVAAVSHRRATEALLGGEHPPWEADPEDPIGVANPLLPGILEARSAAALAFLEALGIGDGRGRR